MDDLERADTLDWARREISTYEACAERGETLALSSTSCGQQAGWIRRLLELAEQHEIGPRWTAHGGYVFDRHRLVLTCHAPGGVGAWEFAARIADSLNASEG